MQVFVNNWETQIYDFNSNLRVMFIQGRELKLTSPIGFFETASGVRITGFN